MLIYSYTNFIHGTTSKEYFIKLKSPWSVHCDTPFYEPVSWVFNRANVSDLYDTYIYTEGRFYEKMIGRYNIIIKYDGRVNALDVQKVDLQHAGQYECWPKPTSFDYRQKYNLTVIESSYINISTYENKSIVLKMNISYMGHKSTSPVFECNFDFGASKIENEVCETSTSHTSWCTLEKIFEPDDNMPYSCGINFDGKIVANENLTFDAIREEEYVMKGSAWNMSCATASSYPMKWFFDGTMSNAKNVTLFSSWKVNDNYSGRYHFNNSEDHKSFYMMISRVDVYHSGIYKCTSKSDHLVERKISLMVINESIINLSPMNLMVLLTMMVTYAKQGKTTPTFSCDFNKKTKVMLDVDCKKSYREFIKCQLVKTYHDVHEVPDRCRIQISNFTINEQHFEETKVIGRDTLKNIIISFLVFILITIIIFVVVILKKRKLQSTRIEKSTVNEMRGDENHNLKNP